MNGARISMTRRLISTAGVLAMLASVSGAWLGAAAQGTDSKSRLAAAEARVRYLAQRTQRMRDEREIERLQRIYGYYLDRALWDQITDLFADNGTIEIGMRGVYVGKKRIRESLELFGPQGLSDGRLTDHANLQPVITVAPDGKTAAGRVKAFLMLGKYGESGNIGAGTYENRYVKENGVWKIQSLHFYTAFATDYDAGWATSALPAPTASDKLPPDRPPTVAYKNYPTYYVPPFHYPNPVSGEPVRYAPANGEERQP